MISLLVGFCQRISLNFIILCYKRTDALLRKVQHKVSQSYLRESFVKYFLCGSIYISVFFCFYLEVHLYPVSSIL
jgi:hypothetical protein